MPNNRPRLLLGSLVLLASTYSFAQDSSSPAGGPPAAGEKPKVEAAPPTEAELALDEAIKKIKDIPSVSADIAQSADFLGQRFTIKGRFLKAPGLRYRMELTVSGLAAGGGQMIQVSDGQTLWDFQQVLNANRCQTLRIDEVNKKLQAPEFTAEFRDQVLDSLGFAGPEALLTGLRKAIRFEHKEAGTLEIQGGKGGTESRDVWVLRGEWQDREALIDKDPRKARPMPATGPMPPYVPSLAVAWIGRTDGWPYKIQLEGRAPSILSQPRPGKPGAPPAAPKPGKGRNQDIPSRLVLLYGNVNLSPELGAADFAFSPPDPSRVTDSTKELLDRLDQKLNSLQNEEPKADEASKSRAEKGETVVPEAAIPEIGVPKIGPGKTSPAP